jgi:hypothetical protein
VNRLSPPTFATANATYLILLNVLLETHQQPQPSMTHMPLFHQLKARVGASHLNPLHLDADQICRVRLLSGGAGRWKDTKEEGWAKRKGEQEGEQGAKRTNVDDLGWGDGKV